MTPLPRRATGNLRCSSTISRQPAAQPRPKPGGQKPSREGQGPKPYGRTPNPYGRTPKPYGQAPESYGRAPKSYDQTPRPNGQSSKPYGQASKTYDQTPRPYGQTSKPFGQSANPNPQKPRAADASSKSPKGINSETGITPKASAWAKKHNVGFPTELQTVRLREPPDRQGLVFKLARRRVFRAHHMYDMFTGYEKVGTAYTLYRYEQRLGSPLWLHIEGSHNPKPIVRNVARRRVREGIRAALEERGYTFEGKVADEKGEAGGAWNRRKQELRGTVEIFVQDPVTVANKSKERHIEFGRHVIRCIEEKQATQRGEPRQRNYRF